MPHALIIDDDTVTRMIVEGMLEQEGYQSTGLSPTEVKRALTDNDFDIVITDVLMPDVDGIEIATFIRSELAEEKKNTPIIAISGGGLGLEIQQAMEMIKPFVNGFVSKPVNKDELIKKIEELIAK